MLRNRPCFNTGVPCEKPGTSKMDDSRGEKKEAMSKEAIEAEKRRMTS